MKDIFVINGSASENASNQKLIDNFTNRTKDFFRWNVFNDLKTLPHFNPKHAVTNTPNVVLDFRTHIETADGIIICTPEYLVSIPSGLKNALEWCVSTTVFTDKPVGIITASANGEKGHEELQRIMRTLMTKCTPSTSLLIQGIKGKFDAQGNLVDAKVKEDLKQFMDGFKKLVTGR